MATTALPNSEATNISQGWAKTGLIQRWKSSGSGTASCWRCESLSVRMAGKAIMAAARQTRMPPPATSPNSATPVNSASPAMKKPIADARALIVIPGPTLPAVPTIASSTDRCPPRNCR